MPTLWPYWPTLRPCSRHLLLRPRWRHPGAHSRRFILATLTCLFSWAVSHVSVSQKPKHLLVKNQTPRHCWTARFAEARESGATSKCQAFFPVHSCNALGRGRTRQVQRPSPSTRADCQGAAFYCRKHDELSLCWFPQPECSWSFRVRDFPQQEWL